MAISPIQESNNLVSFIIKSNGSAIIDKIPVKSIEINMKADAADEAVICVLDSDFGKKTFKASEIEDILSGKEAPLRDDDFYETNALKDFKLGREISIALGYDSKNDRVFKGLVIEQKHIINSQASVLQITCKNIVNDVEQIRKQAIDLKKPPVLEITYGVDLLEGELNNHYKLGTHGYLKFSGTAKAKVNDNISIKNMEPQIKTPAIITGVNHSVKEGMWTTTTLFI